MTKSYSRPPCSGLLSSVGQLGRPRPHQGADRSGALEAKSAEAVAKVCGNAYLEEKK